LNFAFFQIMFLRTMLFRSLKNLFFCIACRCPRAVKPNFPAFEFIHVRFIETCCREYHITVVKLSYMKHFDGLVVNYCNHTFPRSVSLTWHSWSCSNLWEWLISLSLTFELINSQSGMNDNNKDRTKAIAAIPMAVTSVAAALLLSGVSLIICYQQPAMAQQNMTGAGGEGDGGAATTTDNATSTTITDGAAQGGNATNATTAAGVAGGNQSTSEVRMNIEQARMALQNNDTHSAMMYLDMALSALGGGGAGTQGGDGGNMTSTTGRGATNATTGGTEGGAPLEGIFGGGG
jgi:hypothetical protein